MVGCFALCSLLFAIVRMNLTLTERFKAREYGCLVEFIDSKEDFYSKTGTRFTTPPSMADW